MIVIHVRKVLFISTQLLVVSCFCFFLSFFPSTNQHSFKGVYSDACMITEVRKGRTEKVKKAARKRKQFLAGPPLKRQKEEKEGEEGGEVKEEGKEVRDEVKNEGKEGKEEKEEWKGGKEDEKGEDERKRDIIQHMVLTELWHRLPLEDFQQDVMSLWEKGEKNKKITHIDGAQQLVLRNTDGSDNFWTAWAEVKFAFLPFLQLSSSFSQFCFSEMRFV